MSDLAYDAKRPRPRTTREAKMSPRERKLAARAAAQRFSKVRAAEAEYSRQLRKIARRVGDLVRAYAPTGWVGDHLSKLRTSLEHYATLLDPWARAVARRMLADVDRRNLAAWTEHSQAMGLALERELKRTPTGDLFTKLMAEQVHLITSLPREASVRVHQLASGTLYAGARPPTVAEQILRTGEVTESRAALIARTEVSRASTMLTMARAVHIGSIEFIWRTSRDGTVRPTHKKLEGRTFRWDVPPECDPGHRALPGAIFNCRCSPEPVIPDDL